MNKKKILFDIPFIIILLTVVYTTVSALVLNKYFSWQNYAGIFSILVCLVLYFAKYKYFKYLFLFVLVIGSFNLIQFTFNEYVISFILGLTKLFNFETLGIQLFSFSILLLFVILNGKRIGKKLKKYFQISDEEKEINEENQVLSFEKKFVTKSRSELEEIIENKESFTAEAIKAAQRLLDKNQTNTN